MKRGWGSHHLFLKRIYENFVNVKVQFRIGRSDWNVVNLASTICRGKGVYVGRWLVGNLLFLSLIRFSSFPGSHLLGSGLPGEGESSSALAPPWPSENDQFMATCLPAAA